jgi:putative NADPH-quinone reductase
MCRRELGVMAKRILIINGHPDPRPERYCVAIAEACAEGARAAGHSVKTIAVAAFEFDPLRYWEDWKTGKAPAPLEAAQEKIGWADHIIFIYPLWLGCMPALTKAFLEQTLRPGFAVPYDYAEKLFPGLLKGKSARVIVTMGMPAFIYRWFFFAHSTKLLRRNIFNFCGIAPVRETIIGNIMGIDDAKRRAWLQHVSEQAAKAA